MPRHGGSQMQVSVSIPVPAGTKAKMLDVIITKTKLKVGLKGQAPIVDVSAQLMNLAGEAGVVVAAAFMARMSSTDLPMSSGAAPYCLDCKQSAFPPW
jgi:hypothetical protein